jgi:hypothetical protein
MEPTLTGRGVFGQRRAVLSLPPGIPAALATTGDRNNPVAALQHLCRSVPVVDLVNLLASTAAQCNASDLHIEPRHDHVAVRYSIEPQDPAGPRSARTRSEREVSTVTLDAMTWKARVPPQAPEIAHGILARLRDSRA